MVYLALLCYSEQCVKFQHTNKLSPEHKKEREMFVYVQLFAIIFFLYGIEIRINYAIMRRYHTEI